MIILIMYFPLSDSEPDPPVFNYIEGMEQPEKQWEHFSEFLLRSV